MKTVPLSLSSIAFTSARIEDGSDALLSAIVRVNAMGIRTPCLNFAGLESSTLDPSIWSGFLKSAFTSPPRGPAALPPHGRCRCRGNGGIYLAVVNSPSLRELDLSCGSLDDAEAAPNDLEQWLWLTCALFSPDASNGIHTVSLNMATLDMSYVESMREFLSNDDPLACMYEHLDPGGVEPEDVRSTASAAVLRPSAVAGYFDEVEQSDELVEVESGVAYRVVRDDPEGDWIEFAVAGLGICWAHRSEVLEMMSVPRRETHSVRHLHLYNVTFDSDPYAVTEFLELNTRLLLCCAVPGRRYSYSAQWVPDFLAQDNKPLPGRFERSPGAETLAFLSAVTVDTWKSEPTKKKTTTSPAAALPAQHKLGQDALRLILDLAALTPRRTCMVFD